ncbi:MAG: ATP-dependent DNA helicase RecG [Candidatus Kapaibacterium sp.]|nr:MAG: ATP-dependent DNA helicase RecG [Candidatus Kapabacteria bacterium]
MKKDSPLQTPVQYLKGVGPRRAEVLAAAGVRTIEDLLYYVPRAYIERTSQRSLRSIAEPMLMPALFARERESVSVLRREVSIIVTVERIAEKRFRSQRTLLEAIIRDETGTYGALHFWNGHQYYRRVLSIGKRYIITGVPELDRLRRVTFTHPQLEPVEEDDDATLAQGILPLYRLTEPMRSRGITQSALRQLVRTALESVHTVIADPLPLSLRQERLLPSLREAFENLHFPASHQALERAHHRMKYQEIFFFELLLAVGRERKRRSPAPVIAAASPRWEQLCRALPFSLTGAQRRAIETIATDLASGRPMHRLLQGDVGAGKTLVALAAMLATTDAGYQSLLAVPTEVLAEQHWRTIRRLTSTLDLEVVKLVGSQSPAERRATAHAIASGHAQIVVGTHALFAESATEVQRYHRVGLVVIDEQHRFGVVQRARLEQLASASHPEPFQPHVLVMSATPIPRTLTMTLYGDLDVTTLDELPAGRQPVRTLVLGHDQLDRAYEIIRTEVRAHRQAFIVYPLVEESERVQLKAASAEFERLAREQFPTERLALVHGQMSWNEKEHVMERFAAGDYDILVATTVIEVGIDVPNAAVMLIEHAERFGLAQLHQLRGRVGRGTAPATCLLITEPALAQMVQSPPRDDEPPAVVRLRTMAQTTNGFLIAEADMRLRGPGDMLGTRQAGMPDFRFVDLASDADIIAQARQDAVRLLEHDPHFRRSEHARLREHLLSYADANTHFSTA